MISRTDPMIHSPLFTLITLKTDDLPLISYLIITFFVVPSLILMMFRPFLG